MSHPKDGLTTIIVVVDNKEDVYNYKIEVYDDGESSIEVTSRERDRMFYRGSLDLDDK